MDIDPDDLLRRLAYGGRKPMLRPRQRIDGSLFARLLDEMANAHTLVVRQTMTDSGAHRTAVKLRAELPPEAFGVYVDYDPRMECWNVIVYHQVPRELRIPRKRDEHGNIWIGPREVGRVLRITPDQAGRVMDASGCEVRRVGGRSERRIRQSDLAVLANRKGRWQRRTRKAA